jgi:hypothetical protein
MPQWIDRYKYIYILDIDESQVISVKSNEKDINSFSSRYNLSSPYYRHGEQIDWKAVARDYCGFEVPPPYKKPWTASSWWSSIDVPSGCIWSGSCINEMTLLGKKSGDEWELYGEEGNKKTSDLGDEIEEDFYDNILYDNILGSGDSDDD